MRCAHCGTENAVFCGSCGQPLVPATTKTAPGAPAIRYDRPIQQQGIQVEDRGSGGSSGLGKFIGSFLIMTGIVAASLVAASTALSVSDTKTAADANKLLLEGAVELLIIGVAFLALIAIILLYRRHSA